MTGPIGRSTYCWPPARYSAPSIWPATHRGVPRTAPWLPYAEESAATVPEVSSNLHQPTRLGSAALPTSAWTRPKTSPRQAIPIHPLAIVYPLIMVSRSGDGTIDAQTFVVEGKTPFIRVLLTKDKNPRTLRCRTGLRSTAPQVTALPAACDRDKDRRWSACPGRWRPRSSGSARTPGLRRTTGRCPTASTPPWPICRHRRCRAP